MIDVFAVADHIISPMGIGSDANFDAAKSGLSAIERIDEPAIYPIPFWAAKITDQKIIAAFAFDGDPDFTFLEKLLIKSISNALAGIDDFDKTRTMLIVASTKGNIDLLKSSGAGQISKSRLALWAMAEAVSDHFGFPEKPMVVSNACISGVSALLLAKDWIAAGHCDHAVVCGGDLVSEFVLSGFHAFKAISEQPCRPFDAERDGISLGEAAATIVLSRDALLAANSPKIRLAGGGQSNDANHISGPSRDGSGLKLAVVRALAEAGKQCEEIDYVNAHGTATIFNDEMEALAFSDLGFGNTPLNSLKGFFGHTLGAAGVLESAMCLAQMRQNVLLASKGFRESGTSKKLNVLRNNHAGVNLEVVLKTNSGFGGCNAAIIFEKLQ